MEITVAVHSPAFSFKYIRGNEYQGDAAVAQIAVSCGAESAGRMIGTEGEALDLSEVNLPGGDFEGAKFIGMSSIKLDGADFS